MLKIIILLSSIFSLHSFSFRLSPVELTFNLEKKNLTQTMTLENPSEKSIPIEVQVLSRNVQINGKEIRKPNEDFLVFPQQMILKPKQKRSIRLTYVGKKNLKKENAYRVHVRQVPVQLKKGSTNKAKMNLQFAYEYFGSLYAKPAKAQPELIIKKITKKGNDQIKVLVENKGGQHALLTQYNPKLIDTAGNKIKMLSEEANKEYHRVNVLAGSSREFSFNLPKNTSTEIKSMELIRTIKK